MFWGIVLATASSLLLYITCCKVISCGCKWYLLHMFVEFLSEGMWLQLGPMAPCNHPFSSKWNESVPVNTADHTCDGVTGIGLSKCAASVLHNESCSTGVNSSNHPVDI